MDNNYIVSARKYRPSAFDAVVGQRSLTETLRNAIRSGHLAHAYLFCGPRGVGKTTCARIFAKTINCLNPTEDHDACNECESCKAFNEQRSLNIHELDAASNNSVDDIRSIIDMVRIPPQIGKYSVFIIDEVHMLSQGAFNALLKTLEEPPSYAIFILATTEKHKVLPTILSRCQVFDFQRITISDIVSHLRYVAQSEGVEAEEDAIHVVAQKADGGMRDALSIFDQLVTFCGKKITYEQTIKVLNVLDSDYYFSLVDSALSANVSAMLLTLNEILDKGFDGGHFLGGFASHLRDLLVSKDPATTVLLEASETVKKHYAEQAAKCNPRWLFAALDIVNQTDINYRTSRNKRLTIELMFVKLASLMMQPAAPAQPVAPAQPQAASVRPAAPQAQPARPAAPAAPAQPQTVSARPVAPQPAPPAPAAAPQMPGVPVMPTSAPAALSGPIAAPTIPGMPGVPGASTPQPTAKMPAQPTYTGAPDVPFTVEQMADAWKAMRVQICANDKRLDAMLSNIAPERIDDTTYQLNLLNAIQLNELQNLRMKMLEILRARLHNNALTLQMKVAEGDSSTEAYTAEDRLKLLQEANPQIQTLRSSLGLILE